jgi:hypothetical protein
VCGFGLPIELLDDGKIAGVSLTSRHGCVSETLMVNGVEINGAAVVTVCATQKLADANPNKRFARNSQNANEKLGLSLTQ